MRGLLTAHQLGVHHVFGYCFMKPSLQESISITVRIGRKTSRVDIVVRLQWYLSGNQVRRPEMATFDHQKGTALRVIEELIEGKSYLT